MEAAKQFNETAGHINILFQDFEHQCKLSEVSFKDWVRQLMSLLEGGGLEAYILLDER